MLICLIICGLLKCPIRSVKSMRHAWCGKNMQFLFSFGMEVPANL